MFIDGNKIRIRDRTSPVHFEFEKLFPVNVLHSNQGGRLPVAEPSHKRLVSIRNSKAFSKFFRHAVSPCRPGTGGKERSGQC